MDDLWRWTFFMAGFIPGVFIGVGLALLIVGTVGWGMYRKSVSGR